MSQLTNIVKTIRVLNSTAAGSTDITTATVVDTAGYDAVRFIFLFGALTATTVVSTGVAGKATNSPTPGTDDLAGSKITVADTESNKIVITDIQHPQQRYLRPFIKRATANAVVDGIIVELYKKIGKLPVTQDATVSGSELWDAPAVGTA